MSVQKVLRKILEDKWLVRTAIICFAFLPLLPNKVKGLPTVLLATAVIISLGTLRMRINRKIFILNTIPYLLLLFGLLYTENMAYATRKLETGLSLFILPIAFGLMDTQFQDNDKRKLLRVFRQLYIAASFVYTAVLTLYLIDIGLFKYYTDVNFVRHFTEAIPLIGQHPIYASIILSLAIILCIEEIVESKKTNSILLFSGLSLPMFIFLFFLASKGVILTLIFALVFMIIMATKTRLGKRILIIICGAALIGLSFYVIPSFSARVESLFEAIELKTDLNEKDSTEIRKLIYLCSVESMQGHWWFGHGTGDVGDALLDCYRTKTEHLYEGQYNSHNQYLNVILGNGLTGLLVFLIFLGQNFYLGWIKQNKLLIVSLLFFSIVMLFENILSRQTGVILFAFFLNGLIFFSHSSPRST